MKDKKAQASFEYVILLTLFLGILSTIIFYSTSQVSSYVSNNELSDTAKSISLAVNKVGAVGPGTSKVIIIEMPKTIVQAHASYKEIVLVSNEKGRLSDMHFPTTVPVFGLLETSKGKRFVIVRAEDNGYVSVMPLGLKNFTKGLIAYYNFEQMNVSTNNIKEGTGKITDGILADDVNCNNDGYVGKGCIFDGDEDYIDCGNDASFDITKQLSIVAWIKTNDKTLTNQAIITKSDSTNVQWELRTNGENIEFKSKFGAGALTFSGTRNILEDYWHHVAVIYDGKNITLYLDGIKDETYAQTGLMDSYPNQDVMIGKTDGPVTNYFNGSIDEVMIYNRALIADEIDKLHTIGRSIGE